jgi:hypothetical protein
MLAGEPCAGADRPATDSPQTELAPAAFLEERAIGAHAGVFGRHTAHEKRKPRLGGAGLSFAKRGTGVRALHG